MLQYLHFISICLELGRSKIGHSTPDAVFKCRHLKDTSLSLLFVVQPISIRNCQSSLLTTFNLLLSFHQDLRSCLESWYLAIWMLAGSTIWHYSVPGVKFCVWLWGWWGLSDHS